MYCVWCCYSIVVQLLGFRWMKCGTDCSLNLNPHQWESTGPLDKVWSYILLWCDELRTWKLSSVCEEELKTFIVLLYLRRTGSTNMATEGWEPDKSEQNFRKHIRYVLSCMWNGGLSVCEQLVQRLIHSTDIIRYAHKCDVKQVLSILVISYCYTVVNITARLGLCF